MGRILLHPKSATQPEQPASNPLPATLQTPSGLAILEIQGTLNSPAALESTPERDSAPLSFGRLTFPLHDQSTASDDTAWHKRVHLYIGEHQRLTGELKKLANPIAIIQRRPNLQNDEELEIAEIIYYKLMFTHRPEPVGGASEEANA